MEHVLYADVLFIVNFSMDYVTLYLTASLLHLRKKVWYMVLASTIGAIGGVLSVIYIRNSILSVSAGIVLCAVMTYIAFGKSPFWQFIRRGAAVWGSGAFIGGVVTAAASAGRGFAATLPGVVIGGVTAAIAVSRLTAGGIPHTSEVELVFRGNSLKLPALVDSGNLLKEPVSGRPVVLITLKSAGKLIGYDGALAVKSDGYSSLDSLSPELKKRARLIPYRSVEGTGMLIGFIPDKAIVDEVECDAVFAVENTEGYGGYSALVPASVAKRRLYHRKNQNKNLDKKILPDTQKEMSAYHIVSSGRDRYKN